MDSHSESPIKNAQLWATRTASATDGFERRNLGGKNLEYMFFYTLLYWRLLFPFSPEHEPLHPPSSIQYTGALVPARLSSSAVERWYLELIIRHHNSTFLLFSASRFHAMSHALVRVKVRVRAS